MAEKTFQKIGVKRHTIDPRQIKLLDLNARYMKHETYQRLVENIRTDGVLTSVPFCWLLRDDNTHELILSKEGQPVYEVLSGNHRVKASIDAGLPEIDILYSDEYLDPDRRAAIQLSHNAITGEDDPAILKIIYEGIEDIHMRLYTGTDDKTLQLMKEVSIVPLSEANLSFQNISMTFLPEEAERVQAAFEAAKRVVAGSKAQWLVSMNDYDRALDALEAAGAAHGIKNTATALRIILSVFEAHIDDLTAGFIDQAGEPRKGLKGVPLEVVIDDVFIPAALAARLKKVADTLISQGKLETGKRWRVLENLLDGYEKLNTIGIEHDAQED